ncbi:MULTISPECIES: type II toxin-antitoxin system RatA family toxin [Massilia]|uniref:Ubiquinone-binding protein n=2 Tax=Massilia TaxID=149698 RepID=A0A7X3K6A9_9BURK|nr:MULTISPECIES: type II toxin-antitoxin system RatA family toxin [Telluria group]KQX98318.1 cyclase [Massilia sp. Root133]KQZ47003.1 cyclase [Massilia sp. Root1485]MDN4041028.1 type II toxin-antitoxin system RatA family toxin [Massilia sp. YIM B02787]MVW59538.1 ubiquinone-binding protein [Telluria cellulosilytica]
MAVVHKSVFLGYSAEQMFDLVAKVEDYPKFLPWCSGVKVLEHSDEKLVACLQINFHGVKQSFTTSNHNQRPGQMKMHLVDGPFKMLEATWSFKPLRADACKIDFDMQYEFSSIILEQLVGPVFGMIANTMVDSFCKRAEVIYG